MRKQFALTRRCLTAVVLLGTPGGVLLAQSSVSGTLYENTISVDTVAIAAGSGAIANVGGIYVDNSVLQGSAKATTVSLNNVAIAAGRDASSRLGGITMKNATVSGSLKRPNIRSGHSRAGRQRRCERRRILVQNAHFNGSISSTTAVSDRLALSLGGFGLFFFAPSHIGGVRITR